MGSIDWLTKAHCTLTMGRQPRLDQTFESLLSHRESQGRLRRLTLPGTDSVDFSSNGYLSLSSNPSIRESYLSLLQQTPSQEFSLGSGGSRLLDGNSTFAEQLEREIANFHHAPAGLLFNSGFEANTGLFACAPQKGDVIVYDELIHASVHDGMKLSRARRIPFAHNAVYDIPAGASTKCKSLKAVLQSLVSGESGNEIQNGKRNVFIAVEGVYSMDGDVAPLRNVVECVESQLPSGNGYIIVDEAHSTGVFGEQGRGLVCQLGLEDRIWARLHTFGKAMGCSGAIVLCSGATRSYLINYARSLIYTTAMGFPSLASIKTSYDFLSNSGNSDVLLRRLQNLIQHSHSLLLDILAAHNPPGNVFRVNPEMPESPVIPLFTGKARKLALYCQERGFMVRPIVAPTVPAGTDRVRLCLHAGNTIEEVEGLAKVVEQWVCEQLKEQSVTEYGEAPVESHPLRGVDGDVFAEKSRL